MCGIAGILSRDTDPASALRAVERMAGALAHRGPDYTGTHQDGAACLGHARLKIIDLSPEANQPMLSDDGQLAVVFNGEIYNFQQLARQLRSEGVSFRTRCDTEVLLKLYQRRGIAFLHELRGMFAFAIWDRPRERLLLARDRVGQKPLFFHDGPGGLAFASELRSLLHAPGVEPRVDLEAMQLYLSLGYMPHTHCIVQGAHKVRPGCYALWERGKPVAHEPYWRLQFRPRPRRAADAVAELRHLLQEAVTMRMISDVPLGAFLSGGIDSSLVVALMARASGQPVKTFSMGFAEKDFSEVAFARKVARRYRTDHHEQIVRSNAAELLPILVRQYGEPFADPSAVPTYLLSQMTRQRVTVALSGDGGDEAFCGYTRYAQERVARLIRQLPPSVLGPLARLIHRHLPARGAGPLGELGAIIRGRAHQIQLPDDVRWRMQFGHFSPAMLDELLTPELRGAARFSAEELFERVLSSSTAEGTIDHMLDLDSNTYLPDNIFVKVDIASMAHSLEVRSPFVDHKVLEFAATLPPELKMRGLRGKRIMRLVSEDLLPRSIVHRRKRGFGIPHARWLRGDLRSMARDSLLSPRALGRGYFERGALTELLDEHDSGRFDHGLRIWNLLWLELWHREFADAAAGAA